MAFDHDPVGGGAEIGGVAAEEIVVFPLGIIASGANLQTANGLKLTPALGAELFVQRYIPLLS